MLIWVIYIWNESLVAIFVNMSDKKNLFCKKEGSVREIRSHVLSAVKENFAEKLKRTKLKRLQHFVGTTLNYQGTG